MGGEDRIQALTAQQMRRRRRVMLDLLWVCTVALVGWAIYIGLALPGEYDTRHWDLAWSGFDGLEILAFGATAYYGWRGRQLVIGTAIAAATLLVCDAWFDIALDLGTPGIWGSLASAVFVELPLAFFLVNRVRLLLRITILQLFPDTDEKGRSMSIGRLPLLTSIALSAAVSSSSVQGVASAPGVGQPADHSHERDTDATAAPAREPGEL